MNKDEMDEILGVTRCARCGHRLNGEIECPFCSLFPDPPGPKGLPLWIFLTACFLTSPLSLYAIVRTDRLTLTQKLMTFSGCLFWAALYHFQPWNF